MNGLENHCFMHLSEHHVKVILKNQENVYSEVTFSPSWPEK